MFSRQLNTKLTRVTQRQFKINYNNVISKRRMTTKTTEPVPESTTSTTTTTSQQQQQSKPSLEDMRSKLDQNPELVREWQRYERASIQHDANTMTNILKQRKQQQHHDHHHHPHQDTAYDPALNRKFNLPPIPKDGVYRRPRVDMNAHGPWQVNADAIVRDPTDMVSWFDNNAPLRVTTQRAFTRAFAMISFWGITPFVLRYTLGDELAPNCLHAVHPGPLPELISAPNAPARKLVVEMV